MDRYSLRNSQWYCESVPLETLARAYGTPLYVYSQNTMRDHFMRMDAALRQLDHMICYAVKANSNLAVIKTFADLGAGFDIVSAGELYRVIKAGGDPRKAVFAGVGKTADEIRYALDRRVYCFNVESDVELLRINAVAKACKRVANFCLRVNPDVDPRTHKYITTGKKETKFGMDFAAAMRLYRSARRLKHTRAIGVQMHIGSQITSTTPYITALKRLAAFVKEVRAAGVALECVDIGGGMGIIYKEETPPTPRDYAVAVIPLLKGLGLRVLFEPGRFLVGNAGVLLTTVQYVKQTPAKTFLVVDAGMNDLIRPSLYEAYHAIVPIARRRGRERVVDVVGPICESGDFLALARPLPPTAAGDVLAVRSAGAYGFSMASNYNSRPRAAEVMVDGRRHRLVRRRETWPDLIAGEKP
jgi:diaminopimelate decarboxylase